MTESFYVMLETEQVETSLPHTVLFWPKIMPWGKYHDPKLLLVCDVNTNLLYIRTQKHRN